MIKPIEFETSHKLIMFLDSLFELKPHLKTSFAFDKFRIVVGDLNSVRGGRESLFCALEDIIIYLRNLGCKVPVVFYEEFKLSPTKLSQLEHLKKKYIMLFSTDSYDELQKFCTMGIIQNI